MMTKTNGIGPMLSLAALTFGAGSLIGVRRYRNETVFEYEEEAEEEEVVVRNEAETLSRRQRFMPFEGARLCVGGHKFGVWVLNDRCYKRYQDRGRGDTERAFLQLANDPTSEWHPFVPRLSDPSVIVRNHRKWLVMENILSGFKDGVIMDVKMGTRTWGANASEAKRRRKAEKDRRYTTSELGLRLVAAEIKGTGQATVKLLGDKVGVPITDVAALREGIYRYLHTPELRSRASAILKRILRIFRTKKSFVFYSSSLLFAYDAATVPRCDTLRVKMIDFAHVETSTEEDVRYIAGLQSLLSILNPTAPVDA